jgi:nucleoside-diphosphate-sugar epimerase
MIVILGHTGFIGAYLLRHLADSGRQVIGLSARECDLSKAGEIRSSLGQLPRPFDLINCAVINRNRCHDYSAFEMNCRMLRNLVEALPPGCCRSFIHLSSVDVYGKHPPLSLNESTPAAPDDFYGLAKFTGEGLLRLGLDKQCQLAILRLPGVYGVADGGNSLVGGLTRKIIAGQPVTLTGRGELRRDCLAIGDLAALVEALLEAPRQLLVNVATGSSYSLLEMVDIIAEVGGVRPEVSVALSDDAEEKGDLLFDVTGLRLHFQEFAPQTLRQGIGEYVAALRGVGW